MNYQSDNDPVILMKTTHGDIKIRLYPLAAPRTVENFMGLAFGDKEYADAKGQKTKGKYYDGLIFHRVIKDFMIQGGDILGNGTGGPGYKFDDELGASALGLDKMKLKEMTNEPLPDHMKEMTLDQYYEQQGYQYNNSLPSIAHKKGVLSMANSGPNSNGSQFFITVIETSWLNGKHTVFGEVVEGMEVAEKISLLPVDRGSRPFEEVKIISVEKA